MFWNLFLKMKVHVCHFSVKGNLSNLLQSISKKKTDKRRKYSEQLSRIAPKSEKTSPKNKTKRPAWRYVKVLLIWFFSHESTLSEFSIYSSLKKKKRSFVCQQKELRTCYFCFDQKKERSLALLLFQKKCWSFVFVQVGIYAFCIYPSFSLPKETKDISKQTQYDGIVGTHPEILVAGKKRQDETSLIDLFARRCQKHREQFCYQVKFGFGSIGHQRLVSHEPKKRGPVWAKELWGYLIMEMAHERACTSSRPERKSGWPKNWRMNDETYLYIDDSHKIEWLWHQRKWKTSYSKCSHPTDSFQQGGHL